MCIIVSASCVALYRLTHINVYNLAPFVAAASVAVGLSVQQYAKPIVVGGFLFLVNVLKRFNIHFRVWGLRFI